jgi:purine-binding chemotaxis protein CheW
VPKAPPFVGGLINVRGRVVPLADLRIVFGMNRRPPDEDTRIVVLETEIEGEATVVGVIADKVHEVTDIESSSVESAPRVGMRWRADFVAGIGKRNGEFIIIPDLGRIFETEGSRSVPTAAERAA